MTVNNTENSGFISYLIPFVPLHLVSVVTRINSNKDKSYELGLLATYF
jgi:hypothetical protein